MKSIHLIQYETDSQLRPKPIAPGSQTYKSGYWSIPIELANSFKGGNIYFHQEQKSPSFLGGVIKDCWIEQYRGQDRMVFKFESSSFHEGIFPKNPDGWDRWMKVEK